MGTCAVSFFLCAFIHFLFLLVREPLWDPFCGSGTILAEALLARAAKHFDYNLLVNQLTDPPKYFSFQQWNTFPIDAYQTWFNSQPKRQDFLAYLDSIPQNHFVGSDISESVTRSAEKNWAALTNKAKCGNYFVGDFEKVAPSVLAKFSNPPVIFSNLPYGVRLNDHLNSIYNRLARFIHEYKGKYKDFYVLDGSSGNHFLSISSTYNIRWNSLAQFSNGYRKLFYFIFFSNMGDLIKLIILYLSGTGVRFLQLQKDSLDEKKLETSKTPKKQSIKNQGSFSTDTEKQ